jgi:hypothetical protein
VSSLVPRMTQGPGEDREREAQVLLCLAAIALRCTLAGRSQGYAAGASARPTFVRPAAIL